MTTTLTLFTYKPTEDRRRSEFVYTYQHHPHNGVYLRKIVKKANDLSFYVAHWLLDSNASNIITPCPGCHLHHPGQGRHNWQDACIARFARSELRSITNVKPL